MKIVNALTRATDTLKATAENAKAIAAAKFMENVEFCDEHDTDAQVLVKYTKSVLVTSACMYTALQVARRLQGSNSLPVKATGWLLETGATSYTEWKLTAKTLGLILDVSERAWSKKEIGSDTDVKVLEEEVIKV